MAYYIEYTIHSSAQCPSCTLTPSSRCFWTIPDKDLHLLLLSNKWQSLKFEVFSICFILTFWILYIQQHLNLGTLYYTSNKQDFLKFVTSNALHSKRCIMLIFGANFWSTMPLLAFTLQCCWVEMPRRMLP